jgi:NitT/TauT family transport system substrate-binding protein
MRLKITIGFIIITGIVFAGYYISKNGMSGEYKSSFTGPVEKVTLAAYEGEASLPAYVAEEYGLFEQNGLAVTILGFESGKAAADALLAGQADLSTSASGVLVSNSFTDPDLEVLGSVAALNVQGLVARKDSGITIPSDLVGKKIGVTKNSHGEFNLGMFLIFHELSANDVEIIDLTPGEIVEAVVSGEIDAGFTWEPNIYNIKVRLANNAVVWKDDTPEFYFVLLSKKTWLENNPDTAKRFIKAIVQAEEYVKNNEESARQFMKKKFSYEQDYALSTWEDHNFSVQLHQSLLLELENIARWRVENNLTSATEVPNYLDYIYFDALEAVKPEAVSIVR